MIVKSMEIILGKNLVRMGPLWGADVHVHKSCNTVSLTMLRQVGGSN